MQCTDCKAVYITVSVIRWIGTPLLHILLLSGAMKSSSAVPVKWPALCLNYQLLGARYADERDVGGTEGGGQKGEEEKLRRKGVKVREKRL